MTEAAKINATYKDLLKVFVWLFVTWTEKIVMFNRHSKCSGAEALLSIFKNKTDEMPDRVELLTQLRLVNF